MWERVRKFLGTDEEPADDAAVTPDRPERPAGPPQAPPATASDATPTPEQVEETAPAATPAPSAAGIDVSPPGHAPQGLAAEPGSAPPTAEAAAPIVPPADQEVADVAGDAAAPADSAVVAESPSVSTAPGGADESAHQDLPPPSLSHEAPDNAPTVAAPPDTAEQPATTAEAESAAPATSEAAPAAPETPAASESADLAAAASTPGAEGDTLATEIVPGEAVSASATEIAPSTEGDVPATETAADEKGNASATETAAIEEQPAIATEAIAPPLTPLAPGAVVADRYTVTEAVAGDAGAPDAVTYQATDARSYERCWSCGSTANTPATRFCQNCGAPVQNHPVTLVQTREASGEEGEVKQDGAYFHVEPERRLFGAEGIGIEIGAYSAEGPHHPNEDSYWYTTRVLCANSGRQSTGIVVFADGMGGYAPGSGLISSRVAATAGESILAALGSRTTVTGTLDAAEAEAIMREAIAAANGMVLAEIAQTGEMGSTLVAAIVHGDTAYLANVGDSRAYYIDPHGRTTAITRDQSLVGQEVQQGRLAESDIYTAAGNNIILHAIGEQGVEDAADCYTQSLEPGSYLLVCSDGYWKTLQGAVLPAGVLDGGATLGAATRGMVDSALVQGSDDNTTVVLIAIN